MSTLFCAGVLGFPRQSRKGRGGDVENGAEVDDANDLIRRMDNLSVDAEEELPPPTAPPTAAEQERDVGETTKAEDEEGEDEDDGQKRRVSKKDRKKAKQQVRGAIPPSFSGSIAFGF